MKLITNKICRKRYKVETKVRRWVRGARWFWSTGPEQEKQTKKNKIKGGA